VTNSRNVLVTLTSGITSVTGNGGDQWTRWLQTTSNRSECPTAVVNAVIPPIHRNYERRNGRFRAGFSTRPPTVRVLSGIRFKRDTFRSTKQPKIKMDSKRVALSTRKKRVFRRGRLLTYLGPDSCCSARRPFGPRRFELDGGGSFSA